MRSIWMKFIALVMAVAVLAGCVSKRLDHTFGKVRTDIADRSGQRIVWHRNKADMETAQARVHSLLDKHLRLEEALEIAVLRNPGLQATYESIGLAEADVVEAMLPPNPSFETIYKKIRDDGHIWEFIAVQEVIELIMIPWRKRAAEANADRVQARVTAAVLDTLLEINVAYRRAQAAEQALRMMQTTLQSDRAAYDMAKRLREAGNITKLELKGRNAVLQQTKQALSQAELQLAERREALNRLMGLTTGELNWTMASPEG